MREEEAQKDDSAERDQWGEEQRHWEQAEEISSRIHRTESSHDSGDTRTARTRTRTRTNKTHNLQAVFAPKLQSRRGLFLVRQRVAAIPTGRLRYFSIFASAVSRLSDVVSEKGALSAAGGGKLLTRTGLKEFSAGLFDILRERGLCVSFRVRA